MTEAAATVIDMLDEGMRIDEALELLGQEGNDELRRNVQLAYYPVRHRWTCTNSSTGYCVYDNARDASHDECLVCAQPEERK
jgi:hypothetical protein